MASLSDITSGLQGGLTWESRIAALQKLQAWPTKADRDPKESFNQQSHRLALALSEQLCDIRSEIVREARDAVAHLVSLRVTHKLPLTRWVKAMMNNMLQGAASGNSVIRGYAKEALLEVMGKVATRVSLKAVAGCLTTTKSKVQAEACAEALFLAASSWGGQKEFSACVEMVEAAMLKGVASAWPGVREHCASCYWALVTAYPQRRFGLQRELDGNTKKTVQAAANRPPDFSVLDEDEMSRSTNVRSKSAGRRKVAARRARSASPVVRSNQRASTNRTTAAKKKRKLRSCDERSSKVSPKDPTGMPAEPLESRLPPKHPSSRAAQLRVRPQAPTQPTRRGKSVGLKRNRRRAGVRSQGRPRPLSGKSRSLDTLERVQATQAKQQQSKPDTRPLKPKQQRPKPQTQRPKSTHSKPTPTVAESRGDLEVAVVTAVTNSAGRHSVDVSIADSTDGSFPSSVSVSVDEVDLPSIACEMTMQGPPKITAAAPAVSHKPTTPPTHVDETSKASADLDTPAQDKSQKCCVVM